MDITELNRIVLELTKNKDKKYEISPRELFDAFHCYRRTPRNCEIVDSFLIKNNMELDPCYNDVWIDMPVNMQHKQMASSSICSEPIKKIKILKSAHVTPMYVDNNDDLKKATTIMQMYNFSQLPVTNNGLHNVVGYISWESIGIALSNGIISDKVKCYVKNDITILELNAPLMDVIETVRERDFAVVINDRKELCGIITTADITAQFISNTEPFVYLEQIESLFRILLKDKFLLDEIKVVCVEDNRKNEITSIDGLTFGEYIRLIGSDSNWQKLGLNVDKKIFIERMEQIRQVRNDVMHFEPAGITDEQRTLLSKTSKFLSKLVKLQSQKIN